MIKAIGYAAQSATAPLAPMNFERRSPRPDDVAIEILFCGVCHSDIHQARDEWGFAAYPLMPGHEIVGKVTAIGADVSKYKVGQLVGVGCMVDSCRSCDACKANLENYCQNGMTPTYAGYDRIDGTLTMGGYSNSIVVSDRFVVSIPENSTRQRPRRFSARASLLIRHSSTTASKPVTRWACLAWAASVTWVSSSPRPWALK